MLKTIHHRVIIKLSFLGALRSSLFQLLILALSGSIFSLYDIKQKTKKVRGLLLTYLLLEEELLRDHFDPRKKCQLYW